MSYTQSFCYPCYQNSDTSLDTLFAFAAKTGYKATELWFRDAGLDELVATARKHGLTIASMCGHTTLTNGMNNPANHDRIAHELHESIDVAVKHQIPNLITFSGNYLPDQSNQEAIEQCAACLKPVMAYAEKHQINLNIELLNSKVDHPGYACDHTAFGVALCKRVGSPRAKMLYDIYHMQIMEGDIIRTIREHIQYIGHFHTAGNPGRRDIDDQQELYYPAIARAINATGYTGYLAHEFTPKGDKLQALAKAFVDFNLI